MVKKVLLREIDKILGDKGKKKVEELWKRPNGKKIAYHYVKGAIEGYSLIPVKALKISRPKPVQTQFNQIRFVEVKQRNKKPA